jgi:hypothetical protein
LILFVPILLSQDLLPSSTPSVVKTAAGTLLGAAGFAIVYLFVFNVRTRQSLHDLALGTFVVDGPGEGQVDDLGLWRMHWVIMGIALLSFYLLGSVLGPRLAAIYPFPELMPIPAEVQKVGIVREANVEMRTNNVNGVTSTGIRIKVSCNGKPEDSEKTATEIVAAAMRADPRATNSDYIEVIFLGGFKIGLAQFHGNETVSHSPAQWSELIRAAGIK